MVASRLPLNIEIINTGSELMLGFVTNTNQQWLCRELSRRGFVVSRQVAVSDDAASIQQAVAESLGRAEAVLCTGGLGPTSDDLTRQVLAEWLGQPLAEDPAVLARIEEIFRSRRRPMPPRVRIQALVPAGALVLPNRNGTAPGLAMDVDASRCGLRAQPGLLILLPGPPRELEPMFLEQVVPLLSERFPGPRLFSCLTLRSTGIGESAAEALIAGPLEVWVARGLQIGYCARFGEVDIRLLCRGPEAESTVRGAEQIVRSLLGKHIFGTDQSQLEAVVVESLTQRRATLALAESCTGGYIAHRLTNIPGASAALLGGLVTYSNDAKVQFLGVRPETLARSGAVSEETAREMAEGAQARFAASYALAVTGIAGPGGGTAEKPVGTVYLALAGRGPTLVLHQVNRYDRESFKFVTSQQALELLRRRLMSEVSAA